MTEEVKKGLTGNYEYLKTLTITKKVTGIFSSQKIKYRREMAFIFIALSADVIAYKIIFSTSQSLAY